MPDDSGGSDIVHVQEVDALRYSESEMANVAGTFRDGMTRAGEDSASPAAAGGTIESKLFMTQERQARESLVQFMTKTGNGLDGYHSAVTQLRIEHEGLVHLTRSRLQALLRPQEGPVRTDPAFDWRRAVQHQLHPELGGN
ncbi:hypothetical protein [Kribbella sp. HUAS MG21]|jgi:hypothetical protein|uniref:Uncharacterized protein n=1 Tax=Kribbella sp. HUAS MG21 TaxID=3160966 RepID=A0AAU7TIF3_9ACTN